MLCVFVPEYQKFHCIAGKCPDSCCTGWEIVVDPESAVQYTSIPGDLGERLRHAMTEDADGDILFKGSDSRCPFWNQHHLCDIQSALGETALCDTCRQFPRITQDYGDFIEYDLSLSCPEAARLLLTRTPEQLILIEEQHPEQIGDLPEYDPAKMQALQRQRSDLFQLIRDTSRPALEQLRQCLQLVCQWENSSVVTDNCEVLMEEHFLAILDSCEILTQDWDDILTQAAKKSDAQPFSVSQPLDAEIRAFAFDFLYRNYLRAAFTESALPFVQQLLFSVCAVLTILHRLELQEQLRRLRIWQLFAKEMESDSDNLAELEWALETEAVFSPRAFDAYLKQLGGT